MVISMSDSDTDGFSNDVFTYQNQGTVCTISFFKLWFYPRFMKRGFIYTVQLFSICEIK